MKILVLGGTIFLGRHVVDAALERGHDVTLFHRGRHGADVYPQLPHILGDRDGGLDVLGEAHYDCVVDCCGYVPRVVRQSAEFFASRADRYLFVSSVSVYADPSVADQDETAPVAVLDDPLTEDVVPNYGGLKALCEQEVEKVFRDRAFIVRPGLIAGPFDPSNRFTYWVDRIARGGDVLALRRPDQPVQVIDARDLASFMVAGLESKLSGTYNTVGENLIFGEMLDACLTQNPKTRIVQESEAFFSAHAVKLWQDLPLTLGVQDGSDGMERVNGAKAIAAGLATRPMANTAADTWSWRKGLTEYEVKYGMPRERELEILAELGP